MMWQERGMKRKSLSKYGVFVRYREEDIVVKISFFDVKIYHGAKW